MSGELRLVQEAPSFSAPLITHCRRGRLHPWIIASTSLRPARIAGTVGLPLAYPRSGTWRGAAFLLLVARVPATLREAIA